jgi:hypothetical protein
MSAGSGSGGGFGFGAAGCTATGCVSSSGCVASCCDCGEQADKANTKASTMRVKLFGRMANSSKVNVPNRIRAASRCQEEAKEKLKNRFVFFAFVRKHVRVSNFSISDRIALSGTNKASTCLLSTTELFPYFERWTILSGRNLLYENKIPTIIK